MSNSSANPELQNVSRTGPLLPLSHYSSLDHLEMCYPSNTLLVSLLLPLPPSYNSHQSSQNANPFRSWIIPSKLSTGEKAQVFEDQSLPQQTLHLPPAHSALDSMTACFIHQAPLPQGLPFPALDTLPEAYKVSASPSLTIQFKTATLAPTHSSVLVYFSP